MDEIKGIARAKFHPGTGGPKLFTPWLALQDQKSGDDE